MVQKATYMRVLQKQIHGDSSYRFEYFDALHHILGKEIDPLGMREQAISQSSQALPSPEKSARNFEYQDVSVDEGFVWVHSAVNLLLDHVRHALSNISSPATIQERWEEISEQMASEGYEVSSTQCQRKWENMQCGYHYYQTKSQATGLAPRWPYFTRVKDIMIVLNIPVTVQVDLKTDLSSVSEKGVKRQDPGQIQFRKRFLSGESKNASSFSMLGRVRQLESNYSVNRRLDRLERRVEEARLQRESYNQTNSILTQIVSELRKINQMVESENDYQYGNHHQQHIPRPGSPGHGIIIVEDFSDHL